MRKSVSSIAALLAALLAFSVGTACASTSGVVISQVYGGGGNSGAPYQNDFIELFNAGSSAVDISGWSVQYTSATGKSWSSNVSIIPDNTPTLQPGQYFLIQEAGGSTGDPLPTADFAGGINMSGSKGKVALVNNATALSSDTCPTDASIVDLVGFGSANCYEGTNPVATLSNAKAAIRAGGGCTDTDDNASDFAADTPTPRNTSTATNVCSGGSSITVSIADVGHSEGNSGTTAYDFVVTLSAAEPVGGGDVTFDITTNDGTATTADNDYTTNSATGVTIAEGQTTATFTVLVNGDTTVEPDETFTVTASDITGTNVGTTTTSATGTIYNDDATDAAIYEIQGSPSTQGTDGASPYVGQLVHTRGIVTVIDPGAGFYVQTSDAESDHDPLTSDGIYVYDTGDTVAPGDAIDFNAEVSEYYGMTELSFVSQLSIQSSGNALPTAVEFNADTPSTDPHALSCGDTNFECFEGMLVHIGDGLVTQGSGHSSQHTYDYLYVTATGKRSLRDPGLLYGLTHTAGDNDAAPIWDGNPEVFEMSPNEFTGVYSDQTPVNGGSTFTATGVIGYDFGAYEFYPAVLDFTYAAPMPRPVPMADPAILRIGEFNVERFCDDVSDVMVPAPTGTAPIPPGKELYECSGGSVPSSADYDEKAQRIADYIGTVLNLPDVVAVEEVENIDALTKLADKLNSDYGIVYTPKLDEGNDVSGIDVGYLVNEQRVQIDSIQQLDKDLLWHTPNGHDRNVFDHPPLLLQGTFIGNSQNQPFMVLVNHLKARQDVDDVDSNGNPTASASEDQEKRFREAVAVALQVQSLQQTGSAQVSSQPAMLNFSPQLNALPTPLIVVGDFNAYQFTDGYADLIGMISGRYDFDANLWDLTDLTMWNLNPVNPPFTDNNLVNPALWNAIDSLPENEQYSYLYAPNFGAIQGYGLGGEGSRKVPTDQVLDHALLNTAARANFVRMDFGRADEDAPSEDEKNSTGAIGVSDHDGFVIQLTFDRIFANGFENKD